MSGLGWVVADPTPDRRTPPPKSPSESVQAAPTSLPQANAVPVNQAAGGHAVAKRAPVVFPHSHRLPGWLIAALAVGVAVLLVLAAGPGLAAARRRSRRKARRQGDPPAMAAGAWLELLDSLQQAGMVSGRGATSAEVAAEAGRHFGPEVTAPVQQVGDLAERAVFCRTAPPAQDDALEAWNTLQSVRGRVHRRLDRRQRWRALVAVGSAPKLPVAPGAGPLDRAEAGRR